MSHKDTLILFVSFDSDPCQNNDTVILHDTTYVTSPNFPRDYDTKLDCTWKFKSQNDSVFDVKFKFTQIDEYWDTVKVGYGTDIIPNNTILSLDHLYFPRIVTIRHIREIWVQLLSDEWLGYAGFFVEITKRKGNESGKNFCTSFHVLCSVTP